MVEESFSSRHNPGFDVDRYLQFARETCGRLTRLRPDEKRRLAYAGGFALVVAPETIPIIASNPKLLKRDLEQVRRQRPAPLFARA